MLPLKRKNDYEPDSPSKRQQLVIIDDDTMWDKIYVENDLKDSLKKKYLERFERKWKMEKIKIELKIGYEKMQIKIKVKNIINIHKKICESTDQRIKLLRYINLIMYLFGVTSFLFCRSVYISLGFKKDGKRLEDIWGLEVYRKRNPKTLAKSQWSGQLGEFIGEEIFILLGEIVNNNPKRYKRLQNDDYVTSETKELYMKPDLEIANAVIEIKMYTYFTEGTAKEKLNGDKYINMSKVSGKKVIILYLANAEKYAREECGKLPGSSMSENDMYLNNIFRDKFNVTYVGGTDLLLRLIN